MKIDQKLFPQRGSTFKLQAPSSNTNIKKLVVSSRDFPKLSLIWSSSLANPRCSHKSGNPIQLITDSTKCRRFFFSFLRFASTNVKRWLCRKKKSFSVHSIQFEKIFRRLTGVKAKAEAKEEIKKVKRNRKISIWLNFCDRFTHAHWYQLFSSIEP